MFYRPNFCCNCGEKIERVEWTLFASGKFCELCHTEFRAREWGVRSLATIGIVFAAGLMSSFFRPPQTAKTVITSEPVALSSKPGPRLEANLNTTSATPSQSQTGTNANTSTVSQASATSAKQEQTVKTTEEVYYCGAATKKGAPCSRRVKRPGDRCWQHQGMPSILDEGRTPRK